MISKLFKLNVLSMTSIKYNHLQVTETGKFHQYPLRNVGGVAETKTSVGKWLKLIKGHNSGKKQSSLTSVQYDPLQVMATIT